MDDYERRRGEAQDLPARRALDAYRRNLLAGIAQLRALAAKAAYPGENLASLGEAVERAEERLRGLDRRGAQPLPAMAPVESGAQLS